MKFSARQIAQLLDGKVEGNDEVTVERLSKIEEATEGSLSFLANPQYTPYIYKTKASIVIVNDDFKADKKLDPVLVRVKDAYRAFAKLLNTYKELQDKKEGREDPHFISGSAEIGPGEYIGAYSYIGENVRIGKNVKIYPHSYIGDRSTIGDNSIIYNGAHLYSDCVVGKNVTIHSGCVIGGDGFGFAPGGENYEKVAQIGNVVIEDDVEIGSNTTIDRATLGSTRIGRGVKLDNLIQIAHNVEIGENTVIAAQSGIAGSTHIGKNCMIGGQVGITGHLKIGEGVKIAAQSGIGSNVPDKAIVQGSPAFDIVKYRKSFIHFKNLPQLAKDVEQLKNTISHQ